MNRRLNIELIGPCTEDSDLKPGLNDTVATVSDEGYVRFHTITGVSADPNGMVIYAMGGEKLVLSECYMLFSGDDTYTE